MTLVIKLMALLIISCIIKIQLRFILLTLNSLLDLETDELILTLVKKEIRGKGHKNFKDKD